MIYPNMSTSKQNRDQISKLICLLVELRPIFVRTTTVLSYLYLHPSEHQISGLPTHAPNKHFTHRIEEYFFRYDLNSNMWHSKSIPKSFKVQDDEGEFFSLDGLNFDPYIEVDSALKGFGYDTSKKIHCQIHQLRVYSTNDLNGLLNGNCFAGDQNEEAIIIIVNQQTVTGGIPYIGVDSGWAYRLNDVSNLRTVLALMTADEKTLLFQDILLLKIACEES